MYTTQQALESNGGDAGAHGPPESWLDLIPFLDLGPALQRFNSACLGIN